MPAVYLDFINRESPAARKILQMINRYHIGGVILFGGHPADIRYWTIRLQRESRFPLFIAADLERGFHSVFSQGTMFPHALAFGAAGELSLMERFAEVLAKETRSVGINVCFAPVLDLATDPDNPITNIRALHALPGRVSELARVFIKTVQKYGIACVGKHFPGDDATSIDPHTDLPELARTLNELEQAELLPFHNAVQQNVKALMIGHLKVPGLPHPASMEPALVEEIIRRQWRYQGVLFTDALEMGAIQHHFAPWEQAYLPIEAGVDVLLMPPNLPLAHQLLEQRIREDDAFRRRVEAAVERIFTLKKWLHAQKPGQDHPLRVNKVVAHPTHMGAATAAAERAITLLRKSGRFPVQLPAIRKAVHLIFTDTPFSDQPLQHFCEELRNFFDDAVMMNNPSSPELQSLPLDKHTLTVVSLYFRTFAGHVQQLDWNHIHKTLQFIEDKTAATVLFLFGNPFQIRHLAEDAPMDALFLTYSYVEPSQRAAVKALCSFIPIRGTLPIELPPPYASAIPLEAKEYRLTTAGEMPDWREVDELVENAIAERIFPGCVLLAAQQGSILFHRAYGRFTYEADSPLVKTDTSYDLASLTKVLATTPTVMRLVEEGVLSLEEPLSRFYPLAKSRGKDSITIADLLSHQSGLPAWLPLYEQIGSSELSAGERRRLAVQRILETPLEYPTGSKAVYSDLGFILLWDIIEMVSGIPFDEFCRNNLFQPMGLSSLRFNPPEKLCQQIPPTGSDALRDAIQGEVNDANCYALGGISGHAGLFGTAADVAAMGQLFIQKGIYNRKRLFRGATIDLFSRIVNPAVSNRALGWDTPEEGGNAGKHFSKHSIGHLGFTGTSMWVDMEREVVIVLLSNRTYPDARVNRMSEIRPVIHDALMERLGVSR